MFQSSDPHETQTANVNALGEIRKLTELIDLTFEDYSTVMSEETDSDPTGS